MVKYVPKKKELDEKKDYLPRIDISIDKLPSKSLPYGEDAEIKYRGYTFGEIKSLDQSKLGPKDIFRIILRGVEANFKKEMITVQDCLFIGFLRKMSTVGGTDISVKVNCSDCRTENDFSIDLTKEMEFQDMKAPKLPVVAPLSTGDLAFTPMNIEDIYKLIDMKEDPTEIAMMALQCRNFSYKDATERIYNCDAQDAEVLNEVDKYLHHSILPIVKTCKGDGCRKTFEIKLDIGGEDQNLVLPFRSDKGNARSRIRFGT